MKGSGIARVVAAGVLMIACDPGTDPKPPPFTLTLAQSRIVIVPGSSPTSPLLAGNYLDYELVRHGYADPITMTASTSAAGVTLWVQETFDNTSDTLRSSVSIDVAPGAPPGEYLVRLRASGVNGYSTEKTFSVVLTPFSMTLATPSLTVSRGASSTLSVIFEKDPAMAITVTASGAPSGVTVSGSSSSQLRGYLDVSVAPAAAIQTSSITVTATGGGRSESRSFNLTVQEPRPKRTISTRLCFATPFDAARAYFHANDGEGWAAISPDENGSLTFDATERVAIAARFYYPGFYNASFVTRIIYATATELETVACAAADEGPKTFIPKVTDADQFRMSLGTFQTPFFRTAGARDGPHDLVATGSRAVEAGTQLLGVIRRALNPPDGDTIAVDFASGEIVFLDSATVAGQSSAPFANVYLHTPSTISRVVAGPAQPGKAWAFPESSLLGDDLQSVLTSSGTRGAVQYFRGLSSRTFTFGPDVSQATADAEGDSIVLPVQSEYPDLAAVGWIEVLDPRGAHHTVELWQTRAYAGIAAAQWRFVVPDMGRASSPPRLRPGQAVYSAAASGPPMLMFGDTPAAGAELRWAHSDAGFFALFLPFPAGR